MRRSQKTTLKLYWLQRLLFLMKQHLKPLNMSKLYNLQHLVYALLRANDSDCDLTHAYQKVPDFFF